MIKDSLKPTEDSPPKSFFRSLTHSKSLNDNIGKSVFGKMNHYLSLGLFLMASNITVIVTFTTPLLYFIVLYLVHSQQRISI